ncbi:P-loop containing nucleoside triphosphate hydrolase protein [Dothidotthia symphoricarpi CBS 119687]|uniref:small monomeric GTPase n=1 Tax=Dothidotthia symphoricarpi CBS 119687 TaxID=1392245 RepID=A0A6A6A548_9PLEO|nr:P-loop containing nucleoside triphosphate hydrolase protein [Dothidotthia symphoricarpi CBS 119687]KAF2126295.1 P-loop containing nucleoside triphosphate hydrolase protein [Dothidotthia symphoricarpi CBS 119687]
MSPSLLETIASVVVLGESGVGKTCFTDMFLTGKHFTRYDPTLPFSNHRTLPLGTQTWDIYPTDLSSTTLRDPAQSNTEYFQRLLADADGIVLLYDVTDWKSFECVTELAYEAVRTCRGGRPFACVLVGNKVDVLDKGGRRRVGRETAEEWAGERGCGFVEVSCFDGEAVVGALGMMVGRIREEREGEGKKKRSLGGKLRGVFG